MREAALAYHLSWWQRFWQLELPQAAIGLIWNSMMSVAGGWFFLMACEMFVLESSDFRLPGLGSYLQTAANAGNTSAIFWGLVTIIGVIIVIDQMVWRPVIAWADKFKVELTPRVVNLFNRSWFTLAHFADFAGARVHKPNQISKKSRNVNPAFREAAKQGCASRTLGEPRAHRS
jgi:NitT/TauT family transport system permease protein